MYIESLILKNLRKGLSSDYINCLKYFTEAENYEIQYSEEDQRTRKINNYTELRQYLRYKKVKAGRPKNQYLKTCCAGCFSNYYESYNPIEVCSECGMRMHVLCQKIKGKCERCKYIRRTVEEKGDSHYCFICKRDKEKGLLIQSVKNGNKIQYAHTFCLLTSNSWHFDQDFRYQ